MKRLALVILVVARVCGGACLRAGGRPRRAAAASAVRRRAFPEDSAGGRGGGRGGRGGAPFDMTGYWVSVVGEDWRWRTFPSPRRLRRGAAESGGAQDRRCLGPGEGRGGGRGLQGVCGAVGDAHSRPAARHLAGRPDAEDRDRRRSADAAVLFRQSAARRRSRTGRAVPRPSGISATPAPEGCSSEAGAPRADRPVR